MYVTQLSPWTENKGRGVFSFVFGLCELSEFLVWMEEQESQLNFWRFQDYKRDSQSVPYLLLVFSVTPFKIRIKTIQ